MHLTFYVDLISSLLTEVSSLYPLYLYWTHLLVQEDLFCRFLRIFSVDNHVFCNKDTCLSSFPLRMHFLLFSCFIAWVDLPVLFWILSKWWDKTSLLNSQLWRESIQSLTIKSDVNSRFLVDDFRGWGSSLLFLIHWEVCLKFVKCFPVSVDMIIWSYFYSLACWYDVLHWFFCYQILNQYLLLAQVE